MEERVANMKETKKLSSGKWLVLFLATALALVLLLAGFNLLTDPYGAFGDPVMEWWAYDMTLNPRMAKMTYLEKNHQKYDSYIVGASGSSALPVEELNEYLDASFYNTFFYGTEMETFEMTANYLLDSYRVKNMVLDLSLLLGTSMKASDNALPKYIYWKVNHSSPLRFYSRYLTVTPLEGIQKIRDKLQDGYLQAAWRTINPENGSYDKSRRDVEPIHDLESYLALPAYQKFTDYSEHHYRPAYLDEALGIVSRIKDRCEAQGVRLIVLLQPMYHLNSAYFKPEYQEQICNALAQVTDYWDFTTSSVSYEPRYFYDGTHFRNCIGSMMLARIFGNEDVYVPEDFGRFVPQGSVPGGPVGKALAEEEYCTELPILRYHHLVEEGEASGSVISAAAFARQMQALEDAGYTPVDIWQMRDYVEKGAELPEKPILITFDDGYESNYSIAYPILKEHNFKATIFAIGVSMGKDTYKDTGKPMLPHFSLEQAREMTDSGLITVASHGWDVHQVEGLDEEPVRPGVLMREGETEEEYVEALTQDAKKMQELLGDAANFFSYPSSRHDERSLVILNQAGVFATVAGDAPRTLLIRGLPQCLLDMPRQLVTESMSGEDLLAAIEAEPGQIEN